jgi:hypothetical protein
VVRPAAEHNRTAASTESSGSVPTGQVDRFRQQLRVKDSTVLLGARSASESFAHNEFYPSAGAGHRALQSGNRGTSLIEEVHSDGSAGPNFMVSSGGTMKPVYNSLLAEWRQ